MPTEIDPLLLAKTYARKHNMTVGDAAVKLEDLATARKNQPPRQVRHASVMEVTHALADKGGSLSEAMLVADQTATRTAYIDYRTNLEMGAYPSLTRAECRQRVIAALYQSDPGRAETLNRMFEEVEALAWQKIRTDERLSLEAARREAISDVAGLDAEARLWLETQNVKVNDNLMTGPGGRRRGEPLSPAQQAKVVAARLGITEGEAQILLDDRARAAKEGA